MTPELMVFAKAPTPGQAKTRLIPALGAEGAARLYAAFVRDVVERHTRPDRRLTVWRAGDLEHPLWGSLGARLAEQSEGDLGARLSAAFARSLASTDRAYVLGADSPSLPPALVDLGLAALCTADAVIGPACDGGYWGLGLRAPRPAVFAQIPWSTEGVFVTTLARLTAAGLRVEVLPFWFDVDRPADLDLLRAHAPALAAQGTPPPHHTLAELARAGDG